MVLSNNNNNNNNNNKLFVYLRAFFSSPMVSFKIGTNIQKITYIGANKNKLREQNTRQKHCNQIR
jgi:hypothetical protein